MFEVTIIRNSDGAKVVVKDESEWDMTSEYYWTEGNLGCDCNRRLMFLRALGEEDPDANPCGDTEFSVELPPITW